MNTAKQPQKTRRRLTFAFEAPNAQHVSVVGDFNNWDPKRHPMKKDSQGRWQKAVMLQPGTYEYKFWVDAQWLIDTGNEYRCPNRFGTMNSVITVSPWQQ